MTSNEVLSMYEQIAGLTCQMVEAARSGDWDSLSRLEAQCAARSRRAEQSDVPPLTGAPRLRKVDLIKLILANDRQVRAITEPWMAHVANAMQGSTGARAGAR